MRRILLALYQHLLGTPNSIQPLSCRRAGGRLVMPVDKGTDEKLLQRWMQHCQRRRSRRRYALWVWLVWENSAFDIVAKNFTRRRCSTSLRDTREGMVSLHHQLENHDRQPKTIVPRLTVDRAQVDTLQFWRRIVRYTYRTAIDLFGAASGYVWHLKRIGIYPSDHCTRRNQYVFLVDVADDVASHMECIHGCRQIGCRAMKIAPVKSWIAAVAQIGVEDGENGRALVDTRHQKTSKLLPFVKHLQRPGNRHVGRRQPPCIILRRIGQHGLQFVLALCCAVRYMIDLGHLVAGTFHQVYFAFPALAEQRS